MTTLAIAPLIPRVPGTEGGAREQGRAAVAGAFMPPLVEDLGAWLAGSTSRTRSWPFVPGLVLVSGILVRFADQAKTSMILAGVSRRMAGWPGFTCGSAEDLHTVYIVPAKHLQRLAWNWT